MNLSFSQVLGYLTFGAVASIGTTAQSAAAGAYPDKPIRFVIPFSPGGTTDIQARILGNKFQQVLGEPAVLDNRPGGSGTVGLRILAQAPANGYTVVLNTVGAWTATPHLMKLPYDVFRDFAPIIHVSTVPGVLVVHPSLPVKTVKELIAYAKERPNQLNYGSAGAGGFTHLGNVLFNQMTGIEMTHVPYRSSGAGLTALVGGQIQVYIAPSVPVLPHVRSGKVRAIASTGLERIAILPELPTVDESGVPGFEASTWTAIAAPAGSPRAVIVRLNKAVNEILQMSDVRELFKASAATITGGPPERFSKVLKADFQKFGKLIRDAGIKMTSN